MHSADYHKHLMPDLPGPVKMRQLLIWAVQRAMANRKIAAWGGEDGAAGSLKMELVCESAVQGLFENEINTSWYQRPGGAEEGAGSGAEGEAAKAGASAGRRAALPGPKNQELLDCIQLYERYSKKLRKELLEWEGVQADVQRSIAALTAASAPLVHQLSGGAVGAGPPPAGSDVAPLALLTEGSGRESALLAREVLALSQWISKVPAFVDQLHWSLSVAQSFESHSKTFCEAVFRQIRSRIFGSDDRPAPMLLLRALANRHNVVQ